MNKNLQEIYSKVTGKDWVFDFDSYYAEDFAKEIIEHSIYMMLNEWEGDSLEDICKKLKEYYENK